MIKIPVYRPDLGGNEKKYVNECLDTSWISSRGRFVDDVEFHLDPSGRVIQVRSASRLGHSDLGTNRRRVEAIRQQFGGGAGQESARQTSGTPANNQ